MRSADVLGAAVCVLVVALAPVLGAHRLDEYLQATRIAVSTEQILIELDLTPGEAIAASVVSAIDTNRDGSASADEGRAYAQTVLSATTLEVDGARQPLVLLRSQVPHLDAIQTGMGTVRLEIGAGAVSGAPGAHVLTFRNAHRADVGVYLVNALKPATPRIRITEQRRDVLQRELQLSYEVMPASVRWPSWWAVGLAAAVVGASGLARRRRRQRAPGVAHERS